MMHEWIFSNADAQAAAALTARLPSRLFDSHAHLYRTGDLICSGTIFNSGPKVVDANVWRARLSRQVGRDRLTGGLFLPMPFVPLENIDAVNADILEMATTEMEGKALALVAPGMSPAQIEPLLAHPRFAGFKPYHTFSITEPTFDACPGDYIPEWVWPIAGAHNLLMVLHLVRAGAMADAENLRYMREHCLAYPGARLVLAHAGRAFHAPNALRGIATLADLPNLWFDTAAICEAEPLAALLDAVGPRRLLWGSDFPVSEERGRCVTVGDGFIWVTPNTVNLDALSPACQLLAVGLESLRALISAADAFGLNDIDMQDMCADNARRLLGFVNEFENVTQERYRYAKTRIPGGTQLLSKRPEMLAPEQWPAYFREARGCEVWDLDGRHYYDFSTNGIGACLLGFRDPEVTRAVQRRIALGSMCTLNAPEEVELADLLCTMHPWAEQVRYARCGGEACAIAIRIVRATTDRSLVAICGYSGWQDWYLAANLGDDDALRGHLLPGLDPLGVPRELRGTALTFNADNRAEFQALLDAHGDRLAAVIMEPCRAHDPEPGFLEFVRDGAHRAGALLIFDEITIGFRLANGGAHLRLGVAPDLAVFAKAMGNGHPMAAIIGTREAMVGAHSSFISSTYWTESVGPTAALATLRKMHAIDVPAHVAHVGTRVMQAWRDAGQRHGLPVQVGGYPCLAHFHFEYAQTDALRTLYTQMMLDHGFLAGAGLYPTLAHTDPIIDRYIDAIDAVFGALAGAFASGKIIECLRGPIAHTGFRRLTG